ncbi:MAG: DUF3592 domain-containing protein [Acidobacteriota bacterium]
MTSRLTRMKLVFGLMAGLAVTLWQAQDFIASFAARAYSTRTTLRTTNERDDARVLRAYRAAMNAAPVGAALVTETDPRQQTRDADLTVTAATSGEALAGRAALVEAMRTAFAREGPGELFDIGNAPWAGPVPDARTASVRRACQIAAVLLLLSGLVLLLRDWRASHLPLPALLGALATGGVLVLILLGDAGTPIWLGLMGLALPALLIGVVSYVTVRTLKAARWRETQARIIESRVEVEKHRFSGDTTKVRNLPHVAYEFVANGETVRATQISVGVAPADNVDLVLKHYPVGAIVPVYYDPSKPTDCVLERTPPVSLGALWGGTAAALAAYGAVVAWLNSDVALSDLAARALPSVHNPLLTLGAGGFGLFSLAAGVWNRRHVRKAFPWLQTPGAIVSSVTESYRDTGGRGSSQHTYYKAVIEFSYQVDGQEYHNVVGASDVVRAHVAGARDAADAEVARYPQGAPVMVFYDPQNPTRSALSIDAEMTLDGTSTLIVGAVLVAIAVFASRTSGAVAASPRCHPSQHGQDQ